MRLHAEWQNVGTSVPLLARDLVLFASLLVRALGLDTSEGTHYHRHVTDGLPCGNRYRRAVSDKSVSFPRLQPPRAAGWTRPVASQTTPSSVARTQTLAHARARTHITCYMHGVRAHTHVISHVIYMFTSFHPVSRVAAQRSYRVARQDKKIRCPSSHLWAGHGWCLQT